MSTDADVVDSFRVVGFIADGVGGVGFVYSLCCPAGEIGHYLFDELCFSAWQVIFEVGLFDGFSGFP